MGQVWPPNVGVYVQERHNHYVHIELFVSYIWSLMFNMPEGQQSCKTKEKSTKREGAIALSIALNQSEFRVFDPKYTEHVRACSALIQGLSRIPPEHVNSSSLHDPQKIRRVLNYLPTSLCRKR